MAERQPDDDGDGDGTAAQTAPRKQQQQQPLVERLYGYSQHGDRMYGGTDKMLRFFQYSLACIGCKLREGRSPRSQFAGRQVMAVKHEVDRGRIVSRFFGLLDEVRFLGTQEKGVYLGKWDPLCHLLEIGQHLSLIGYYTGETIWWLLQTCPELDRSLGKGNAWVRGWDGESTWSFRWERWFNWPLTVASCFDFIWCCRRWRLLSRAHSKGEVSDEVRTCERKEIVMDFLGYVVGEMFLNLFGLRNPNVGGITDFWIYFGSLLCPIFNEYGLLRQWTDRKRAAVYDRDSQRKAAAAALAAAAQQPPATPILPVARRLPFRPQLTPQQEEEQAHGIAG